jgi:hypothetical protein
VDQTKLNYTAFQQLLPGLLVGEANKYALLRDGKLEATFETMPDAVTSATKLYPDGRWSIQRITDRPISLGLRSRAVPSG